MIGSYLMLQWSLHPSTGGLAPQRLYRVADACIGPLANEDRHRVDSFIYSGGANSQQQDQGRESG